MSEGFGFTAIEDIKPAKTLPIKFDKKVKFFTIQVQPNYPYEIGLEKINTPMKLIHWIWHLEEKTWMDNITMRRFIEKVCKVNGFDLHGEGL